MIQNSKKYKCNVCGRTQHREDLKKIYDVTDEGHEMVFVCKKPTECRRIANDKLREKVLYEELGGHRYGYIRYVSESFLDWLLEQYMNGVNGLWLIEILGCIGNDNIKVELELSNKEIIDQLEKLDK